MRLLALDTSSLACSVALTVDGNVAERHATAAREHTRLLMPMIKALFEETGLSPDDLDAIVLGNGPGSFIGLRIAASVAQGIAYVAELDIVPVSSLAAVAAQVMAESGATEVAVAQDAHVGEVYLGGFRRGAGELPEVWIDERLQLPTSIAELAAGTGQGQGRIAAGYGWRQYPELLEANRTYLDGVSEVHYPAARYLLPLGERRLREGGAVAPQDVVPAYLRETVARPRPGTRP